MDIKHLDLARWNALLARTGVITDKQAVYDIKLNGVRVENGSMFVTLIVMNLRGYTSISEMPMNERLLVNTQAVTVKCPVGDLLTHLPEFKLAS